MISSFLARRTDDPVGGDRQARVLLAVSVLLAVVVGAVAGVGWTRHQYDLGGWMHERAQLGAGVVSVDHDGWTYGARDSIPSWIDEEGVWHEGGWPTCLRGTGSSWVRFQAREVTVDGSTWRPIIAVDCRS